mmetsp:Transcript_41451/g.47807  ORF Transcript_41451/g.47807 Transcript_41451/m.47807 type:complete len:139 (+) Transcript_41451:288-704(+)
MLFVHSLTNDAVLKFYKNKKFVFLVINLEYQYLKGFKYIRDMNEYNKAYAGFSLINLAAVELCEGMISSITYVIENILYREPWAYQSVVRNFKQYTVLNIFAFLYFMMNPPNIRPAEDVFYTKRMYEVIIHVIIFFVT